MKTWFDSLHPSRQVALVACAGMTLVAATLLLSWHLHEARGEAAERRRSALGNLESMRALVADYRRLEARRGATPAGDGLAGLSAAVNASLQGRSFQPSRVQQSGERQLQLRVEQVEVAEALEWLAALDTGAGLRLDSVSMAQAGDGLVSVQLAISAE